MSFNIDDILSTDIKGANATEYTPVPEGEWTAVAQDVKGRTTDKGHTIVDVMWSIDDIECLEEMGRDEPVPARQSLFLDIDADGSLETGKDKNVQVGRLREALGQNDPKKPWNFNMVVGQQARVIIRHRVMDDGSTRSNVVGVAPLE